MVKQDVVFDGLDAGEDLVAEVALLSGIYVAKQNK